MEIVLLFAGAAAVALVLLVGYTAWRHDPINREAHREPGDSEPEELRQLCEENARLLASITRHDKCGGAPY